MVGFVILEKGKKMTSKLKLIFGAVMFLVCCAEPKIEGRWVQPIPGMEGQSQGIGLEKDGKAESINMYTLVYESWQKSGNKLILKGKSLGNGQTIDFSEDYEIVKLTKDALVLKSGDMLQVYSRESEKK